MGKLGAAGSMGAAMNGGVAGAAVTTPVGCKGVAGGAGSGPAGGGGNGSGAAGNGAVEKGIGGALGGGGGGKGGLGGAADDLRGHRDVVLRPQRSRKFSDAEHNSLFSSRRPSILMLLAITLILILVELQIVLYMRDRSPSQNLRVVETQLAALDCQFEWATMKCSAGCCLRTYQRKGSPVALCEACSDAKIRHTSLKSADIQLPAHFTANQRLQFHLQLAEANDMDPRTSFVDEEEVAHPNAGNALAP